MSARHGLGRRIALGAVVATLGALGFDARPARAGLGQGSLDDAGDAITAIELDKARSLLAELDANDGHVTLERARLAMYEGDCDGAFALLRPELRKVDEKVFDWLAPIAEGCRRATAGTVIVDDAENGVRVRLQDDDDRALVPLLVQTIVAHRKVLERDLGVVMPRPSRIDLVRDQLTLSAMTGLGMEAATTTGTVAIAKFGRVVMVSPRAMPGGYAFRDTLAHEFTHLAISRGTRDRAPLWLQEGLAKREETRWRAHTPIDEASVPDAIAAVGLSKKLGLPLNKLGPSLAMLPSALHATVAYAEVNSFVEFVAGDRAAEPGAPSDPTVLPKLIVALAETHGESQDAVVDAALKKVTGRDLAAWDAVWRPWVARKAGPTPKGIGLDEYEPPPEPGAPPRPKRAPKPAAEREKERERARALRLGELLLDRGHAKSALHELEDVGAAWSTDPRANAALARARLLAGDVTGAGVVIGGPLRRGMVEGDLGRWWAVRAGVLAKLARPLDDVESAYFLAISHDPLSVPTACDWAAWAAGPEARSGELGPRLVDVSRGLCEAARRLAASELSKD
jgi:hypothetical protein